MVSIYDFSASDINGENRPLADYKGKVLLIVNTASKCGFTPQYSGLEALYKKLQGKGLEILGFPCNQFGKQERGADAEIHEFCSRNFGVTFPLFSKIEVNGVGAHPLFDYLTDEACGLFGSKSVKWNFTKFLLDEKGKLIAVFPSKVNPNSEEITKYLN